jgi:D-glycero-D-manno-heptose 1,7-bisphosphate phosphatase
VGVGEVRRRAVFLDRDGVLNRAIVRDGKPHPPRSLAELEIFSEAFSACADLRASGFSLIMVTNQPDVSRGTQALEAVEQINRAVSDALSLDDVRVCYHDDADRCDCRKPAPGLLLAAARDLDIDLENSFMIGDRWKDIEAGRIARCKTILIAYDYSERQAEGFDAKVASLTAAVDWILHR